MNHAQLFSTSWARNQMLTKVMFIGNCHIKKAKSEGSFMFDIAFPYWNEIIKPGRYSDIISECIRYAL